MFGFLLWISCHLDVCGKFNFCLIDFRKSVACLRVTHTAQISTDFVVFVENYYILPWNPWNAIFTMNKASKRNSTISLKAYENGCLHDDHLCSTCVRVTELSKRALGKIKSTSKEVVHVFRNSTTKSRGKRNPT